MAKPEKKTKKDPFKTRKVRVQDTKALSDTITPTPEISEAIDAFRTAQEQAKHFEGEATIQKDLILRYGETEYTKRLFNGMPKSFKIMGDETMVTYVVMDASAGLTEEDVADIEKKWGRKAAEELVTRDFGSIKFDTKVLEANYEAVVEALQVLPEDVLENLFRPMLMKAKSGAAQTAKQYAKTPAEMAKLLKALKIKNYIK